MDPETTDTVDAALVAATGMDVLVHAMEAYVSPVSRQMTDLQALDAVRLVAACLPARDAQPAGCDCPERHDAGQYGGPDLPFPTPFWGAVHAMAHSLGGLLDLPHGECNAILLPHVVDFNYDAEPERYDKLGYRLGVSADTPAMDRKAALLGTTGNMQRVVGIGSRAGGGRREALTISPRWPARQGRTHVC